jgi:CubicO group peptidase (beta-lactamase class C family)
MPFMSLANQRWRIRLVSATLASVSLWCVAVLAALPGRAAPATSPDYADMDAFVQATMHDSGLPGVAVAVVHGDRVVHERGFGVADPTGRAVTPQTPFRIGSNTKGFTALAIMQLVEQGRVQLDAPVQRYLPWFRLTNTAAASQITVRQLLDHTSGIPASALYGSWAEPDLTLEAYGRELASVSIDRTVGSSFEYSNANFNLAGLIVEAVSGQSYAAYVQQHIFEPLDMTHTSARPDEQQRQGLGEGYNWWFGLGPFPAHEPFSQSHLPAAFITSTAEDMAHYDIAQLNGGRYGSAQVLSAQGIERMHAPNPNTDNIAPAAEHGGAGLGWARVEINGVPFVTHTGETFSFKSVQLLDPEHGWGIVLLTNATNQLPSNDEPYRTLSMGILSRVEGWALPSAGLSLHTLYLLVDAMLMIVSAWILWMLIRLPAWSRRPEQSLVPPAQLLRIAAAGLRCTLEIVLPLVLLRAVSAYLDDSPWSVVLLATPDLGRWVLLAATLVILTGLGHVSVLVRALWRHRAATRVRSAMDVQPGLPASV